MKIVIYGGSFNPPHCGHVEAAMTISEQLKPDKLLIIPANIPPHKELAEGSPDAHERLLLTQLAFSDMPNVEVSDIELHREGKSYTASTVELLMQQYPDAELYLAMGTDMLLSFEEWYRFRFLLETLTLAVFVRSEGECAGKILLSPRGEGGFGYDPVFMPTGYDKSMAELGTEVKNEISHRANALKIFKKKLREYNGTDK